MYDITKSVLEDFQSYPLGQEKAYQKHYINKQQIMSATVELRKLQNVLVERFRDFQNKSYSLRMSLIGSNTYI